MTDKANERRELLDQLCAEQLCAEQRARWQAGDYVFVEALLASHPEFSANSEAVLDLIYAEVCLREQHREPVSRAEYQARFPHLLQQLDALFDVHLAIDVAKGVSASPLQLQRRNRFPVRLNCPHCQNPTPIVDAGEASDVVCPSCGSSIRLDTDRTVSWSPDTLPALGKFRLLRPLGRGAFGTVYEALDTELDRTVALKVPRSGRFATQEDEDRFVREARSTAQLRHPGIVSVYEVSHTEPFPTLVCELVEGITLSDAIASRRFTFRESAEIIAQAATALDHAHQNGVYHRDVKPSNLMLSQRSASSDHSSVVWRSASVNEDLVVRLMDFGLARRDDGEVTMTMEGQILGTPAYMSPEQASGRSHHVDGRADVYSLGVILYELLVGELPFRGNSRMLLHQVLNDEPRRPRTLNDRIPRDLETVALKCLEKEPSRRYPSAHALANDLRRFLAGQPITARPTGWMSRACYWCKRNPLAASLVAMMSVLAVGGPLVAINQATLRMEAKLAQSAETAQRRRAVDESSKAAANARASSRIVGFLSHTFQSSDPFRLLEQPGARLTAADRALLDRAAEELGQLADLPDVQATIADSLGNVYRSMGNFERAKVLLNQAIGLRERLVNEAPANQRHRPLANVAATLHNLGWLEQDLGNFDAAERTLNRALIVRQDQFGPHSLEVADTKFVLAWTLSQRVRFVNNDRGILYLARAESLLQDVLAVRRAKLPKGDRQIAITLGALLAVQISQGGELLSVLPALTQILAEMGPDSPAHLFGKYIQATQLRKQHKYEEALSLHVEVVGELNRILGAAHPLSLAAKGDLAGLYRQKGDLVNAESTIREALDRARSIGLPPHPHMATALEELADHVFERGDVQEAITLYQQALAAGASIWGEHALRVRKTAEKLRRARERHPSASQPRSSEAERPPQCLNVGKSPDAALCYSDGDRELPPHSRPVLARHAPLRWSV